MTDRRSGEDSAVALETVLAWFLGEGGGAQLLGAFSVAMMPALVLWPTL